MMNKPRILVTSAAGRNGSSAVLELLRKGFPVRAFVRRNDARSETLRKAGAEIFVGNLFDLSDLRSALVDVQRAYHCPPFVPNLLHGMMLFALAAEEAKLEVVGPDEWVESTSSPPSPPDPRALDRKQHLPMDADSRSHPRQSRCLCVYVFVGSARDRALWHARWAMG